MRYAGLDQALRNSGAAILDGDRFILAEAFRARGEGQGAAFHEFRMWWERFLDEHRPDVVAIEQPLRHDLKITKFDVEPAEFWGQSIKKTPVQVSNYETFLGLYGVRAIALEVCAAMRINCHEVNVATWRGAIYGHTRKPSYVRGSGTDYWKKTAIQRCAQLGWKVKTADCAEASLIADWLRSQLSPLGRIRNDDLFYQKSTA